MKKIRKCNSISLTDSVFNELRTAIITDKIKSGSRVLESSLANEMGVSRTPVREALRKLTQEGLLHAIPNVGYFVENITDYGVRDLFAVRTALERIAARWALSHMTDEELAGLETNLRKTDEIIASGSTEKMIDLDRDFHEIIYLASGSKRLYQLCQILNDHTVKFRMAVQRRLEIAQRTRNGHFKILEAFKSKDPAKAEEAIQFHLDTAKNTILDYLDKLRLDSLKRENVRL